MKVSSFQMLLLNACWVPSVWAESPPSNNEIPSAYDVCLLEKMKQQSGSKTLQDIRDECQLDNVSGTAVQAKKEDENLAVNRLETERKNAFEPFVMTAHRLNYLLPITYSDSINDKAYEGTDWSEGLEHAEAEFQISFKVPLNYSDLLFEGDGLFFGMTLKSFWQVYADEISRPFRETNYRPELFYVTPTPWTPFGGTTAFGVGIEHESNGQRQDLSRSWNRVYSQFYFAKDNFLIALQPWWRIPESDKNDPSDSSGDDNPDIEDYMGHFELSSVYKWNDLEFSFLGRENFSTHKGYAELGLTFPIWGKVRGYAKYSSGYGSSLIDYNQNQQRVGLGIAITGIL